MLTQDDSPSGETRYRARFHWLRGASGSLTLWIDGAQQAKITVVNNSTRVIDMVHLGPVNGTKTSKRDTYFVTQQMIVDKDTTLNNTLHSCVNLGMPSLKRVVRRHGLRSAVQLSGAPARLTIRVDDANIM